MVELKTICKMKIMKTYQNITDGLSNLKDILFKSLPPQF